MTIETVMLPLAAAWLVAVFYASRRGGPLQISARDAVGRARLAMKPSAASLVQVGYYRLHKSQRTPVHADQLNLILAQYPVLAQKNLDKVASHQHLDDELMLDVFAEFDELGIDFELPVRSLSHECQVMSDLGRHIPLGGSRLALANA